MAFFTHRMASWTSPAGNITGATGIEMRAGELNVSGSPVITAMGEYTSDSNGSGNTSSGVGIAVAQHTTKKPISVIIDGGTIKGENLWRR